MTSEGHSKAGAPGYSPIYVLLRRGRWAFFRFGPYQAGALAAASVVIYALLARDLPVLPRLNPDSESYLQFSPVRPHGYSWFLAAYHLLSADLAHLPSIQLAIYIGATLMLASAIGRRTNSFPAALTMLLLGGALTDRDLFSSILSEPLYASALVAATGCFTFYVAIGRAAFLALASAELALAVVTRPIGLVFVPAFMIAVLMHSARRRRRLFTSTAIAALPALLICCAAASSQLLHNGRFVFGTWGGMDVLGKLPLLPRTLSATAPATRLNGTVAALEPARAQLRRTNDPFLEALIAWQYYEYLRWFVVVPDLERSWDAWRDGDEYQRGQLAAQLATAYVAANPVAFARRTAIDFVGLWLMPRWMTEAEHRAALVELARMGPLPFLSAFAQTPAGKLDYYAIVPKPSSVVWVFTFRATVFLFWVVSVAVATLTMTRSGRQALMRAPDLCFIMFGVHAAYIGTALVEGAYERYIMPTWPLLVGGSVIGLRLFLRCVCSWNNASPVECRSPLDEQSI